MSTRVAICDTEPIAIEGLQALLARCEDFQLVGAEASLLSGMDVVLEKAPDIVLIDKSFGIHLLLDWLRRLRTNGSNVAPVVWGTTMAEAEAMRLLQAGAKGVLRKTTSTTLILSCLRTVAEGSTWMEEALFEGTERQVRGMRAALTARELQVAELVERGLKNRDIGMRLGIRPGTVKIHLKHIFEKTGIRGRYGLALSGLKEKGFLSLPPV